MSVRPPAAPADVVTSAAGNPLLDWLNLTDSDGGSISHYRLLLEPGFANVLHRVVYSGLAEFFYAVFMVLAAWGAAGLELVLTPDRWLTPLTDLYTAITARLYQVVPPLAIVAVTFGFLVVSVFLRRDTAPKGPPGRPQAPPRAGWLEQLTPSNAQISTAQWNRLGSGIVLMAVVMILAANPFKLIQQVVNAIVAVASEMTFTATSGGAGTYAARGVTDILRNVSFMINYRGLLDSECARQWSQAINAGGGNPACLTQQQYAAADPDIWTVLMALLAVPIAWGIAKFAWSAAKHLFNHLGLTIANLVAATWIAAGTLARRRPYDPLVTRAAKFGEHGVITVGILFTVASAPALSVKLFTDILSFLPPVLQIPLVSLAFYVSARGLDAVLRYRGNLTDLFSDRIKKSQTWTNLYNLKADQNTLTGQLVAPFGAQMAAPWGWMTDRYQQVQDWTQQRWTQLRDGSGVPAPAQEGPSMTTSAVQPDSPQSLGAQRRVRLTDTTAADRTTSSPAPEDPDLPGAAPTLLGQTTTPIPPLADLSSRAALDAPVVLVNPGGTISRVQIAAPDTEPGAPGYAWERGGIPHAMPTGPRTAVTRPAPPPAAGSVHPAEQLRSDTAAPAVAAAAPTAERPGDPLAHRAANLYRLADALRAEATQHLGCAAPGPGPTDTDQLAAAARTYRPDAEADAPVGGEAILAASQNAYLRAVLASAEWLHEVQAIKNLLAARGVTALPKLPEAAVSVPRIMFACDSRGEVVVRRKNDRGFGDAL